MCHTGGTVNNRRDHASAGRGRAYKDICTFCSFLLSLKTSLEKNNEICLFKNKSVTQEAQDQ